MSIKWKRKKNVTRTEYQKNYIDNNGNVDFEKKKRAYEAASDIRKFEIGLYWQRAAYFWAFITVIYTAYYHVLTDFKEKDKVVHGTIPLVILSFLGLFFSISWLLTSLGSKHWQKNWELHMDLLEDDVTGPLYKTYPAKNTYSVSRINIAAGVVISICAFLLFAYEVAMLVSPNCLSFENKTVSIVFLAVVCIIFIVVFFVIVIRHKKEDGSIELKQKEYVE